MRCSALVLAVVVIAAAPARAQTVDATLTTQIAGRQDPRDGNVHTVVPLYQTVSLAVGGVPTPRWMDGVRIVVSGWGELAFGDPREGTFTGDLDVGFVEGRLARRLTLRVGRQFVFGGAARATQLDGASLDARIWRGLHATVYGGAPVTPRFGVRRGDAIVGARAYFRLAPDAELGASFAHVMDEGRVARQELGFDARVRPHHTLTVTAFAVLSTVELRLAEADAAVTWQPLPTVDATFEYRRTAPDLFIPRSSIFAVFSMETRDEAGTTVYWRPHPRVRLTGDYHAVVDSAGVGQRGGARVNLLLDGVLRTSIGAEARVLDRPGNGYVQARLFAIHQPRPRLTLTVDLDAYKLEQPVNGQFFSFTGAATVGVDFAPGWRGVLSGVGDVTPQVQQRFEVMAKVVYDRVFRVREVKR